MAKYPSIVLHGLLPYDELKVIRGRNVFLGCFVYRQGQEEVLEDWISAIGREASNEKYVLINLDEQPYSIRESMLSLGPLDARSEGWTETVAQKPRSSLENLEVRQLRLPIYWSWNLPTTSGLCLSR